MYRLTKNEQGKYNFIDSEGKLLSKTWYDYASEFKDGLAKVCLDYEDDLSTTFINIEGKPITDEGFYQAHDFKDGVAMVSRYVGDEDDPPMVRTEFIYNYISRKGVLISEKWFDGGYDFKNGIAAVHIDGKFNFIRTDGTYVFEKGFELCFTLKHDIFCVKLNGKYNFIDEKAKFIFKKWLDSAKTLRIPIPVDSCAKIEVNGKHNFITTNGKLVFKKWIRKSEDAARFLAGVPYCWFYAVMNGEGKIISYEQFKKVNESHIGLAIVKQYSGKNAYIDAQGELHSALYKWHQIKKLFQNCIDPIRSKSKN